MNNATGTLMSSAKDDSTLGESEQLIRKVGCVLTTYTRIASAIAGQDFSLEEANAKAIKLGLFTDKNLLSPEAGAALITALVDDPNVKVEFMGSIKANSVEAYASAIYFFNTVYTDEFYLTGRISTTGPNGGDPYGHTLNINSGPVFIDPETGKLNIELSDTSPVNRTQIDNDVRTNNFERVDVFKVTDISKEL